MRLSAVRPDPQNCLEMSCFGRSEEVGMLRLEGGQVEGLWDDLLPEGLRRLPEDVARIDALVRDEALLAPIVAHWEREAHARGRSAKGHGRATIAMQTYVRLLVLKHR